MIKGRRVTIRTDHKPLLEIVAGMAKSQNSTAADKFHHWTSNILAGDPHPTIQYKKGSLNLIADSLSRLRTGDHYKYDVPLHNAEPLVLKEKAEINMVMTHAKSAEQDQLTPKLPENCDRLTLLHIIHPKFIHFPSSFLSSPSPFSQSFTPPLKHSSLILKLLTHLIVFTIFTIYSLQTNL